MEVVLSAHSAETFTIPHFSRVNEHLCQNVTSESCDPADDPFCSPVTISHQVMTLYCKSLPLSGKPAPFLAEFQQCLLPKRPSLRQSVVRHSFVLEPQACDVQPSKDLTHVDVKAWAIGQREIQNLVATVFARKPFEASNEHLCLRTSNVIVPLLKIPHLLLIRRCHGDLDSWRIATA